MPQMVLKLIQEMPVVRSAFFCLAIAIPCRGSGLLYICDANN